MTETILNDEVTGLANRHQLEISFQNSVKNSVEQRNDFTLLVFFLRDLKIIEVEFGTLSSDLVLTCFSRILSNCIHYKDLVFRYQEGQFAVLINDADSVGISNVIERIVDEVENHSLLSEFNVLCKIGCADFHQSDSLDSLFERAKQNLQ